MLGLSASSRSAPSLRQYLRILSSHSLEWNVFPQQETGVNVRNSAFLAKDHDLSEPPAPECSPPVIKAGELLQHPTYSTGYDISEHGGGRSLFHGSVLPSTLQVVGARFMSTAAASAQSTEVQRNAAEASTSGPGEPVPWPWVVPGLPQVLPRAGVPNKKATPIPILEAIDKVKGGAQTRRRKFDETVEMCVKLKVDPRKADQLVRGVAVLPHGTGKPVRICVFAAGPDADIARELGVHVVGDEALIEQIAETKGRVIDFDKCIATPSFMKQLAKVGKVLGPRGMMPSPKLGTLTTNVADAIKQMKQGRLEYRADKGAHVRFGVGKVSFEPGKLFENVGAVAKSLIESKPKVLKGDGLAGYVQNVYLGSSMGPSVQVQVSSLVAAL